MRKFSGAGIFKNKGWEKFGAEVFRGETMLSTIYQNINT